MARMAVAVAVLLAASVAQAQLGGTGVGIILGEPTGLCFKSWLSGTTAVEGGAAWSLGDNEGVYLFADYVLHSLNIVDDPSADLYGLMFTYGFGGKVRFYEKDNPPPQEDESKVIFGARIPLGLAYPFEGAPVDIFVQIVPGLDLIPDTDFEVAGGIGARLYF